MGFDLLAWVLDAGLTASAAKVGKRLWGKTLSTELVDAIAAWAVRLPAEAQLHPAALFPQPIEHEELDARPALAALQRQLQQQRVPTVVQWHQALIEHWLRVRGHAGQNAQAFFNLREDDARPLLYDLARALVHVCERDETFFRSAVVEHLEALREESRLLPVALEQAEADDLKRLATRISDMGIAVHLVLHDVQTKTLTLWVDAPCPTMADVKFKWASIAVLACNASRTDYIDLGTSNVGELRGTDARGHIGMMRVRVPIQAARQLAATRRLVPQFWERAAVFFVEPSVDNTALQRWYEQPFSKLEVPLAPSR